MDAENALSEAMSRVREWITEGGDKENTSTRGIVRGLEAWHTAMVMAGEGVKYRFMPGILQEIMTGLEMTPVKGRTEGVMSEQRTMQSVGTQSEAETTTEKQAMKSVGTQAGAAAEAALTAATQTVMESSVAAATQTDLPLRADQVEVAIPTTERSRVGTPV